MLCRREVGLSCELNKTEGILDLSFCNWYWRSRVGGGANEEKFVKKCFFVVNLTFGKEWNGKFGIFGRVAGKLIFFDA